MSDEKNSFTFHFHAPVGQQIAHVDKIEAHFDKDMNMQVMNTDGAEPTVIESAPTTESVKSDIALFRYIHPSVTDDAERLKVHKEVVNVVTSFPLPEICRYLIDMEKSRKLLYLSKIKPQLAFAELHRMGMPEENTDGFSYANFTKYYNVNE